MNINHTLHKRVRLGLTIALGVNFILYLIFTTRAMYVSYLTLVAVVFLYTAFTKPVRFSKEAEEVHKMNLEMRDNLIEKQAAYIKVLEAQGYRSEDPTTEPVPSSSFQSDKDPSYGKGEVDVLLPSGVCVRAVEARGGWMGPTGQRPYPDFRVLSQAEFFGDTEEEVAEEQAEVDEQRREAGEI